MSAFIDNSSIKMGGLNAVWKEFTVYTSSEGLDAVAARLDSMGIGQLELFEGRNRVEQYLKEASAFWDYADINEIAPEDEPYVRAYIADEPENRGIIEAIVPGIIGMKDFDYGIDLGRLEVMVRDVREEDWANNWKAYYKPIEIGERLLICPSWEEAQKTDRVVLRIDPGMAFGTGSHQTTRLCLRLIEKHVRQGISMLDVGCGSGILSVAALLLGAESAVAVDVDPIANTIAMENAGINGVGQAYRVIIGNVIEDEGTKAAIAGAYDLIAANIVASVIIPLTPMIPSMLKDTGIYISSGIIIDRLEDVKRAIIENGFEIVDLLTEGDWAAVASRKAHG